MHQAAERNGTRSRGGSGEHPTGRKGEMSVLRCLFPDARQPVASGESLSDCFRIRTLSVCLTVAAVLAGLSVITTSVRVTITGQHRNWSEFYEMGNARWTEFRSCYARHRSVAPTLVETIDLTRITLIKRQHESVPPALLFLPYLRPHLCRCPH